MDLSIDNGCDNGDDGSCSHPTDQDAATTSGPAEERDTEKLSADPLISDERVGGIMKIVPPDVDVSI